MQSMKYYWVAYVVCFLVQTFSYRHGWNKRQNCIFIEFIRSEKMWSWSLLCRYHKIVDASSAMRSMKSNWIALVVPFCLVSLCWKTFLLPRQEQEAHPILFHPSPLLSQSHPKSKVLLYMRVVSGKYDIELRQKTKGNTNLIALQFRVFLLYALTRIKSLLVSFHRKEEGPTPGSDWLMNSFIRCGSRNPDRGGATAATKKMLFLVIL